MAFETIIFIAFLSLRKPHDCFLCFSKAGPNVRFSIFQFTLEERQRREMFAKEGNIDVYFQA